jgi:hypothetical protein
MTDATAQALLQRFDQLERLLVSTLNRRLSREDMCERLGVGRSTLTRRIESGKVPRPGAGRSREGLRRNAPRGRSSRICLCGARHETGG